MAPVFSPLHVLDFWISRTSFAKTFARYRGHFGPEGPKVAEKIRNDFPGPLGTKGPKVQNGDEKEAK